MTSRQKAVAFDVDPDSLGALREAFPGWEIEAIGGATADSLDRDWHPGEAGLLVVGARDRAEDALGLCRALRSQAGRAHTLLLALARPQQGFLVSAALAAGADVCLVLPLCSQDLAGALAPARSGKAAGARPRPARPEGPQQDGGHQG